MNEQNDFERLVADQLSNAAVGAPPEAAIEDTIARAGGSRRLPEWLALIKESPMRSDSHTAVGSPTLRVMVVMTATLLLALALAAAGAGVQRLLAADGTIIVAADGSGDYSSIQEAVDAAADGDQIQVMPGTYVESVLIDGLEVDIRGVGPIDEIVLEAPNEQPTVDFTDLPFGLAIVDSNATVSGITVRGQGSRVYVDGGSPTLDTLVLDSVGEIYTGANSHALDSIGFHNGSNATFSNSVVSAGGSVAVHSDAEPTITGNSLVGGTNMYVDRPGPATLIESNTIVDSAHRAIGIWAPGPLVIRNNIIENPGAEAISDSSGSSATIEGNAITGESYGIMIGALSDAKVIDNRIEVGAVGVSWSGLDGEIARNQIMGGGAGIVVGSGAPSVVDNTVEGVEGRGIVIGFGASPLLSGNTSCGNGESLVIADGADVKDDGTNEICEDEALE